MSVGRSEADLSELQAGLSLSRTPGEVHAAVECRLSDVNGERQVVGLPTISDNAQMYEGRTESHEQLFFCMRTGTSR